MMFEDQSSMGEFTNGDVTEEQNANQDTGTTNAGEQSAKVEKSNSAEGAQPAPVATVTATAAFKYKRNEDDDDDKYARHFVFIFKCYPYFLSLFDVQSSFRLVSRLLCEKVHSSLTYSNFNRWHDSFFQVTTGTAHFWAYSDLFLIQ